MSNISETNTHFTNNIPSGVSIESASYIEKNSLDESENTFSTLEDNEEEYTPKLFSGDQTYQSDDIDGENKSDNSDSDQLFDQDTNEEEDFEIPAFLRKQKF